MHADRAADLTLICPACRQRGVAGALGLDQVLIREYPDTPWALKWQERAWQLFLVDLLSAQKR